MGHFVPTKIVRWLGIAGLLLTGVAARAEDAFYEVPIRSLKITEGTLPNNPSENRVFRITNQLAEFLSPYAVVDGGGEGYVSNNVQWPSLWRVGNELFSLRAPAGRDVTGTLFVPNETWTGMQKIKFVVQAATADPAKRNEFYLRKERHYEQLLKRQLPGSSWFRYQAREAEAALAGKSLAEFEADSQRQTNPRAGQSQMESTFDMLSGGRAVSENLQLDRMLPATTPDEPTVDINSLQGITVAAIDWGPLTKDINPETDPLASYLPADQYALLFPSFQAMLRMVDEADKLGTPILLTAEPRSESAGSKERYEKQLCLSARALARLLGDQVVSSVAFTGSDPYVRTGTDVAILFQAKNAILLKSHIATQHAKAATAKANCKQVEGELGRVRYSGAVSADRSVSSYMAQIDDVIVVTNSLAQLTRIVELKRPSKPDAAPESLASLAEYKFFRHRYVRGNDETGLLVITDATIRKWCSAKWRIASSRRTRAAAIMSHYQAAYLPDLVGHKVEPHDVRTILQVPDLGTLRLTKTGVTSSTYGSLEFQTPIAELDINKVTKAEAAGYEEWRAGYQRYWRQFFDPIAVQFSIRDDRLSADLTVMPLIGSSDYRNFIDLTEISAGVELKPTSADPHAGSLMHWAMAINPKSKTMQMIDDFSREWTKASLTDWLGESISLYADADPFWAELATHLNSRPDDRGLDGAAQDFIEQNPNRVPLAFTVEVKDVEKLSVFLKALRVLSEGTVSDGLVWTTLEHNGQEYVKITKKHSASTNPPLPDKVTMLYAATPDLLILTPNEDLLKRALDRRSAEKAAGGAKDSKAVDETTEKQQPATPAGDDKQSKAPRTWLGKSMALQIDGKVLGLIESIFGSRDFQSVMQARAWSNIEILNEWKRRDPDRDPVQLHQQLWQTTLLCPGGGKYVWNEKFQTMESTVYGHPGEPKVGMTIPQPLATARAIDFGLTFENNGLRARVELMREPRQKTVKR